MEKEEQLHLFAEKKPVASLKTQETESKYENLFRQATARPSFSSLEEYYKSPQWKHIRSKKLDQMNHRCEKCGSRIRLHVHHLTYDRKFEERLSDLQVLCKECHPAADRRREEDSAFYTWAQKVYGDDAYMYDQERLGEEFEDWLRWKEDEY